MACKRAATCRARFARGEQACVRCAEGKLDIGDVEDLDDEEDNLDEGEVDDDDELDDDDEDIDDDDEELDDDDDDEEDDDDDDDGDVGYVNQPDGMFGEIASFIEINGRRVPGIRATVTSAEDGTGTDYVIVVEDGPGGIPEDVSDDIDSEVDRYAGSYETLYDVLEEVSGRVIKMRK